MKFGILGIKSYLTSILTSLGLDIVLKSGKIGWYSIFGKDIRKKWSQDDLSNPQIPGPEYLADKNASYYKRGFVFIPQSLNDHE
jgi:hypothetical protein